MDYKNVKIPAWAYENAVAARGDLLRRGLDALPDEVREPQACPRCGSKMEALSDAPGLECSAGCGYRQDRIEGGGVALGVLLGLGVTALLECLGTPSAGGMDPNRPPCRFAARHVIAGQEPREGWAALLSGQAGGRRNGQTTRARRPETFRGDAAHVVK